MAATAAVFVAVVAENTFSMDILLRGIGNAKSIVLDEMFRRGMRRDNGACKPVTLLMLVLLL